MTSTATDFAFLRALLYDRAAIALGEDKEYLLEARLRPVARDLGLGSVTELLDQLRRASNQTVERRVVNAMTTNETSWFRDVHPFEALRRHVLPERIAHNAARRHLGIWSAACSSGQELYSVAMLLDGNFPELAGWSLDLVGTDLSSEMVERARLGRFSGLEINRGLPAASLVRYFERDGAGHRVREELRRRCRFDTFNLARPWPPMARFDVILLRNVLIYFDIDTKRRVLDWARRQLAPGGYLMLGSGESPLGLTDGFQPVTAASTIVYQVKED